MASESITSQTTVSETEGTAAEGISGGVVGGIVGEIVDCSECDCHSHSYTDTEELSWTLFHWDDAKKVG